MDPGGLSQRDTMSTPNSVLSRALTLGALHHSTQGHSMLKHVPTRRRWSFLTKLSP